MTISMNPIYLDNNATTRLLPEAWDAMQPWLREDYGNAASAHWAGRRTRKALEDAREQTAALLVAHPDEVVFTSGATEANNLALFGLAGEGRGAIVASPIEHPSVAEPVQQLAARGFRIAHLGVNRAGTACMESLDDQLEPDTRLVTVMLVNNETGAIQPIKELSTRLGGRIAFHCDAVQAAGRMSVDFHDLGVTTLSISAHKFHGPQGIGALLVRRNARLRPQLWGGHQQQGRRPGTEPVPFAIGLATALDHAVQDMAARHGRIVRLRSRFLDQLRRQAEPVILNGPAEGGLPHTLNLSFPGCRADSLLMNLDLAGVACSTGSACSSGSLLPSPVLRAMGVPDDLLHSAMRFSLSHFLKEEEMDDAAQRIAAVVKRLREVASSQEKVASSQVASSQ
jgi:cysteine desulfurase